jgi:hypothetical protein
MKRQGNDGLRKICKCSLRNWARCDHPSYFSFKPKNGAQGPRLLGRLVRAGGFEPPTPAV